MGHFHVSFLDIQNSEICERILLYNLLQLLAYLSIYQSFELLADKASQTHTAKGGSAALLHLYATPGGKRTIPFCSGRRVHFSLQQFKC